ncbi:hypothetical protein Tco_1186078 [Tanacetum coccineum]
MALLALLALRVCVKDVCVKGGGHGGATVTRDGWGDGFLVVARKGSYKSDTGEYLGNWQFKPLNVLNDVAFSVLCKDIRVNAITAVKSIWIGPGIGHIARECPQPKRPQDSDYFKDKMLLMNAHENGAVLDEEQLLFLAGEQVTNFDDDVDDLALNVDHVFEADQCDAFDSDVDEAPTTQTMFMVQDHDTFVDHMDEYHEVHEMQSDVQHNYVVDSDADYTSDSNIIPYDQYVEDNEEHVVQSNVSFVRNDALMSILDEMHEQGVQIMSNHARPVVHDSEDTRDMAEITRKRMMEKMQSPQYNNDRKKAETSVPKPLSALTVYPPQYSVKRAALEFRLTKRQVKINLYVLTHTFYGIDKNLQKRITNRCYEGKRGVQTALFKEVKVMEEIFDQMSDEVDQNCRGQHNGSPEFNSFFKINNLENQIQEKDNVIRDLKVLVSNVNDRSCEPYNTNDVTALIEQNECVRVELEEVKQHYKELFESIQITRASTNEKTSSLLTQIEDLKGSIRGI